MTAERPPESRGMITFLVVWTGQVVSILGSSLTGFALSVWVYQRTGSATKFALIAFVTMLPGILFSPVAGALVDRWDRRRAMILADAGSGCATLALAVLLGLGRLDLWHIYLLLALNATSNAFKIPAFSAASTLLVPERHLGRASGLMQMGTGIAETAAPALAGVLVVTLGPQSVLLIDFSTFLFSIATLLFIRIPRPAPSAEGAASRGSLFSQAASGWTFIQRRPGLLALLLLFAITNVCLGLLQVLVTPMVLAFATAEVLGRVLSTAALGLLSGGLAMTVWGGPRRRVSGILGFFLLQGAVLMVGGLRPSAVLIAASGFVFLFCTPVIIGSSQALWQSKVPPDLQGRVFAVRRVAAWSSLPLAYLIAGPLADRVFEPLLAVGGPLAESVGPWLGVGKGRGIALLFIVLGSLIVLTVAIASRLPRLTRLEEELPNTLLEMSQRSPRESENAELSY